MKQKNLENLYSEIELFNIDKELTEENLVDIIDQLPGRKEIPIPANMTENIINNLHDIMDKEEADQSNLKKVREFIISVYNQTSLLDISFWMANLIILIIGISLSWSSGINNLYLLSPLFTTIAVFYCYKGLYYNVFEMEMACKYSIYETTIARTIIIIMLNIVEVIITALIGHLLGTSFTLFNYIISWLAFMSITYYVTLILMFKKGYKVSIIAGTSLWVLLTIVDKQIFVRPEYFSYYHYFQIAITLIVGLAIFQSIKRILKNSTFATQIF